MLLGAREFSVSTAPTRAMRGCRQHGRLAGFVSQQALVAFATPVRGSLNMLRTLNAVLCDSESHSPGTSLEEFLIRIGRREIGDCNYRSAFRHCRYLVFRRVRLTRWGKPPSASGICNGRFVPRTLRCGATASVQHGIPCTCMGYHAELAKSRNHYALKPYRRICLLPCRLGWASSRGAPFSPRSHRKL